MQNKYSNIIDRIRIRNDECRKMRGVQLDDAKEKRLANIELPIPKLLQRAKLERNSILFMYIGVLFFVLTSVFIGINILLSDFIRLEWLTSTLFMIGLAFVFIAVIKAYLEIRKAYDIILIEVSELNFGKKIINERNL
ncbi:MAG: DUF2721 domain-containing protein [bacterium]|nr:DUF2721 domain-containing protein [bacterium]